MAAREVLPTARCEFDSRPELHLSIPLLFGKKNSFDLSRSAREKLPFEVLHSHYEF